MIARSYNGLLGDIFRRYLMRCDSAQLQQLATLFGLQVLDALVTFAQKHSDWEDTIVNFMEPQPANAYGHY